QALADGKFRRAVLELDAACQLRRQHPDWLPAGESHELDQLHRQAAALADLLTEYLGDILLRASRTQEDEWADQFALRYKGDDRPNVLLLDARVQRDAAGAYHVDYQVEAGAEPARLEVGDLKLLHGLPLEGPTRLLFAARLASVAREPPGVWVVRLEPDSGVLLTDAAAVAACWAEPLPEDVLQVLARQREWLRGRPQLSRGHSAAPARRRDGTPGQA
ncbi:MAG TPA: hypothetical protein VFA26_21670, partial [Gemmataceae bacterium]|nr:hypothetical protein [Gemmataceae bacterium]